MGRTLAYIGIGSNLGEPLKNGLEAVGRMGRLPGCRVTAVSPWYRSRPVGVEDQPWYVNGVARLETRLNAVDLLHALLGIEADMGRVRTERWGSRIIDLDLLLYGTACLQEKEITVPHPRMHLRRFVVVPLSDLDAMLVHPVLGRRIEEIRKDLEKDETQAIHPLDGI
ncbi:MAG: 2-amino-4-hydroxy-6-hydroxymethyldihydropteridine diphosphokinase [Desulfobacteraceae bacterium]|jgi:2-amino-4-hydroxy-6-hydroxymethyldihydropteridine diphosphokinase